MKKLATVLLILVMAVSLISCSTQEKETGSLGDEENKKDDVRFSKMSDFEGLTLVGFNTPFDFDEVVADEFDPGYAVESDGILMVNSINEIIASIKSGRADYSVQGEPVAKYLCRQDSSLAYIDPAEDLPEREMVMLLRRDDETLLNDINSAIDLLKNNGELDGMYETYVENASPNKQIEKQSRPQYESKGTLVVGINGDYPPFDYTSADGVPAGYNVAFMNRIGEILGLDVEFVTISNDAKYHALSSNRIDVFFWHINLPTTGNEDIVVSDPYVTIKAAVLFAK